MKSPDKYKEDGLNEEDRKEYLLGKAKLYKLSLEEEHELRKLLEKEVPALKDAPMSELIDAGLIRIGIKTIHQNKINEINNTIDRWRPLPSYPYELMDSDPFITVSPSVKAYLKKEGDKIKIYSTNVGDIEISEEELGDRIGTGLDFLDLLSHRLNAFKDYMFSKARGDVKEGQDVDAEVEKDPRPTILPGTKSKKENAIFCGYSDSKGKKNNPPEAIDALFSGEKVAYREAWDHAQKKEKSKHTNKKERKTK